MTRLTRVWGLIGFVIAASVFGARLYMHYASKQNFEKIYPKLEELVAIHSLVAWKNSDQSAPEITEMGDRGGASYDLQCKNIQWTSDERLRPGALLNCFLESRRVREPIDGIEIDSYNIVPDSDFWYEFKWKSHFGYELPVSVNKSPREFLKFEQRVRKQFTNPCAEQGDFGEGISIYQFEIEDLPSNRSANFYAVSGSINCFPDGSVDRKRDWVFYLSDADKPFTVGEINRFMQILMRQMNIVELNPSAAAPKLEALWRNKDGTFASNLVNTFEKIPDLAKFGSLLSQ